jgi:putative heme-binding domain-containing protein
LSPRRCREKCAIAWRETSIYKPDFAPPRPRDTIHFMNISRTPQLVLFVVGIFSAWVARAADPIPITMLVPGFTVRELPVDLTNINSLEYTADGKLWALGYDGRIHVLTDTDGDGLEDSVKTWWQPKDAKAFRGPVGIKVTPQGVYVPSKGKISLIKDTDGDGVGDTEEIVATGWKEVFTAVDATGIAMDREGKIYFGLGCANFADAYQIDKQTKKSHYDISSDNGTIQKLSADYKDRQTMATGVRFAIGIAVNRFGDIFWTDQEGDTWTHGNHLDELNVLLPGKRHYGFPERHPEYLPNTDDEPPVVSFGPQHQSTCGLKFNEQREGWNTFGPKLWGNDALVIGESRGKVWRTTLVKVREGYVGRPPVPVAYTGMLTIDCAVSPKGDLVICCHSGKPDWGTGPTGKGRLFKLSYVDDKAPQPVIAWPAQKDEIRVAFDRPIDPLVESRLTGLSVSCGEFVRAADRIEIMRPPYAVVQAQMQTPRRELSIASARLIDGGRTLSVKLAEPMPWRCWYALAIPGVKSPGAAGLGQTLDVDFQMQGVEARWNQYNAGAPGPDTLFALWLPHFGDDVAIDLTRGSFEHGNVSQMLTGAGSPGDLSFTCQLDLPGRRASLDIQCDRPFDAAASDSKIAVTKKSGEHYTGKLEFATAGRFLPFSIGYKFSGDRTPPRLSILYTTDQSPTPRPIPLDRLLPRWAPTERQSVITKPTPSPLTQGGDWANGKALFFGEAKCATCHNLNGQGGILGPNLSNLIHVNPESVLQDIIDPSLRINPDYVNYIVTTAAGDQIAGLIRQEGDDIIVTEGAEKQTRIPRKDVKEMRLSKISLMPQGFKDLGEKKLKDLLTFLTTEPPKGAK